MYCIVTCCCLVWTPVQSLQLGKEGSRVASYPGPDRPGGRGLGTRLVQGSRVETTYSRSCDCEVRDTWTYLLVTFSTSKVTFIITFGHTSLLCACVHACRERHGKRLIHKLNRGRSSESCSILHYYLTKTTALNI